MPSYHTLKPTAISFGQSFEVGLTAEDVADMKRLERKRARERFLRERDDKQRDNLNSWNGVKYRPILPQGKYNPRLLAGRAVNFKGERAR